MWVVINNPYRPWRFRRAMQFRDQLHSHNFPKRIFRSRQQRPSGSDAVEKKNCRSLPAGFIPTAIAAGDFNGDGKMDFVVANGGDNNLWLYFGKGDGTFSLPLIVPITLGQSPVWVSTADLRGTGRTDLVVAETDSNSVGVFLGNGDGTFAESSIPLPGSAVTLAIGDFNHDGKLDIAVPINDMNSPAYIVVLPGKGDGTFGTALRIKGNRIRCSSLPLLFWACRSA